MFQGGCALGHHTSDSVLEQNFFAHEAEFQLLLHELTKDAKLCGWVFGINLSSPNDIAERTPTGLSFKRWETYQRQLRDLGILQAGGGVGRFSFPVDQVSFANGDSSKGYLYDELEPGLRKSRLDNYRAQRGERGRVLCKPLKGNWYLYLAFN
jgi:hypothetical protein